MLAYTCSLAERARAEVVRLRGDQKGVTALEYGIIAAIMVGAVATAATGVSGSLKTLFTSIGGKLTLGS
ncbi:MAG TPA: Flp family type IVb pilin [Acetobacteraceae bacterium]|jgi:Flp pilus assembly pilin Flp|nr:Flp family type IVb pilin [Acetobacteraceae bacterium]